MLFLLQSNFEFAGVFEGYSRNERGKRRLMLRLDGGDVLEFKVPKEIRKKFSDRLAPGMRISVEGIEQRKLFKTIKRVVSRLRLLSAPSAQHSACARCPIRVCSKKNCWKHGGKELWKYLERRIVELNLSEAVELKAVGCLKNCDYPPNVVYNRERYGECSKKEAEALLEEIAARHGDVRKSGEPV